MITLHTHDGRTLRCVLPWDEADHVVATGHQCECSRDKDLAVVGDETRITKTAAKVSAPAFCVRCKGSLGVLLVEMNTIFGEEEDRAVLHGRARVY